MIDKFGYFLNFEGWQNNNFSSGTFRIHEDGFGRSIEESESLDLFFKVRKFLYIIFNNNSKKFILLVLFDFEALLKIFERLF